MDLHSFSGEKMYFDENLPDEVEVLIKRASGDYEHGEAEMPLLRAYYLAPKSLSVLVALYRFYYYQHRYQDALHAADLAMEVVAGRLNFPDSWQDLDMDYLGFGVMQSMTLVRFYLMTLKGAGYLNLRQGDMDLGISMLEKVLEVDSEDRLGVADLLKTVESYRRRKDANFGQLKVVA